PRRNAKKRKKPPSAARSASASAKPPSRKRGCSSSARRRRRRGGRSARRRRRRRGRGNALRLRLGRGGRWGWGRVLGEGGLRPAGGRRRCGGAVVVPPPIRLREVRSLLHPPAPPPRHRPRAPRAPLQALPPVQEGQCRSTALVRLEEVGVDGERGRGKGSGRGLLPLLVVVVVLQVGGLMAWGLGLRVPLCGSLSGAGEEGGKTGRGRLGRGRSRRGTRMGSRLLRVGVGGCGSRGGGGRKRRCFVSASVLSFNIGVDKPKNKTSRCTISMSRTDCSPCLEATLLLCRLSPNF
ncbi:hypothetical protein CVT26_003584, partial [Gymnopilus dilepis]